MRLVLFQRPGAADVLPGLLTERGVVSVAEAVPSRLTPQLTMQAIIDDFDHLRPALERLARDSAGAPLGNVRLRPPLPRPGKILACIANYWEHGAMEARPLPELVEFATTIMTLSSGDLIACGTNHEGLGSLQDGEVVDFEIHGIGRMRLHVRDPLKRTWDKGVYMGPDSTNPEAIRRNRPPGA